MTSDDHSSDSIRHLFRQSGLEYLKSNRYLPESLGRRDVTRTLYYRRSRKEFGTLTAKYAGALRTHQAPPDLEVRRLGGILGYGLFTLRPLSPWDLIGEYTGIVKRAEPGRPLPGGGFTSDYSWGFPKVRTLGRDLEIDAREAGGALRFANHTADPSAEAEHFPSEGQWHVVFIARRCLTAGEEITVDYGDAYWSGGERELVL